MTLYFYTIPHSKQPPKEKTLATPIQFLKLQKYSEAKPAPLLQCGPGSKSFTLKTQTFLVPIPYFTDLLKYMKVMCPVTDLRERNDLQQTLT